MNTSAISRATGPGGSSVLRGSIDMDGVLGTNDWCVTFDSGFWTSPARRCRYRSCRWACCVAPLVRRWYSAPLNFTFAARARLEHWAVQ